MSLGDISGSGIVTFPNTSTPTPLKFVYVFVIWYFNFY